MTALVIGLYVASYLLAVLDVVREETGLYADAGGPRGVARTLREHPWLVAGGVCGIAATILELAR